MDAGIKTAKKAVYENGVICLSSISSYLFIYLFIYLSNISNISYQFVS